MSIPGGVTRAQHGVRDLWNAFLEFGIIEHLVGELAIGMCLYLAHLVFPRIPFLLRQAEIVTTALLQSNVDSRALLQGLCKLGPASCGHAAPVRIGREVGTFTLHPDQAKIAT